MDTPAFPPATSPQAWRRRLRLAYDHFTEDGGMRDMPDCLYAIAQDMATLAEGRDCTVEYDQREALRVLRVQRQTVGLAIDVLIALGYLRVVDAPGRIGATVYQLTLPLRPELDAAWALLRARGYARRARNGDTTRATAARRAAAARRNGRSEAVEPVENRPDAVREPVDNGASEEAVHDRLDGHDGDRLDGHDGDRLDGHASSYRGYRNPPRTTDVPEVTTDAVVPSQAQEPPIDRSGLRERLAEVRREVGEIREGYARSRGLRSG